MSFELGKKDWKLAMTSGFGIEPWLRTVTRGDRGAVEQALGAGRRRFRLPATARVVSGYEAGRDGLWIHRALLGRSVANRVVDSGARVGKGKRARRIGIVAVARKLMIALFVVWFVIPNQNPVGFGAWALGFGFWDLGFGIYWDNAHMTRRSLMSMLPLMLLTAVRASAQRTATVYKDPNCGCCTKWVELLRTNGFAVTIRNVAELDRSHYPVPPALRSCHTAIIDGHIVEGHVPIADVERMLRQGSAVTGLAVPGMPIGSPGMEVPGTAPQPFNVIAFDRTGSSRVFATYGRG